MHGWGNFTRVPRTSTCYCNIHIFTGIFFREDAEIDMDVRLLTMEDITKAFSGVTVLNRVHLDINVGEVHALVGENGAGKSTLMKILTGVYPKDSGRIMLRDDGGNLSRVEITAPRQAQHLGISIVFQEFNLLDNLSIGENIFIGREPLLRSKCGIDWKKLWENSKKALKEVGLELDPKIKVEKLSVAQKQMVEIAKALSFKSKLIVMDEPTATLTDRETEILFKLIDQLKEKGISIIYISHRMEEIFKITDRITVLRDGTFIGTLNTRETDKDRIISMMVGREFKSNRTQSSTAGAAKKTILEVRNLSNRKLRNVSFRLNSGEILGFYGLVGAGRTEMARALFGIDKIDSGEVILDDEKLNIKSPKDAIGKGFGFVPEDRKLQGLVLGLSIKNNITLALLRFISSILMDDNEERITERYIHDLMINTSSTKQLAMNLSGGNQQKVVIAKWLAVGPRILILDEPTRGIDVGAKAEIHNLIRKLAAEGKSIIMISSELPEILNVSDRIIAMHEGAITLDTDNDKLDSENILRAAVGTGE